MQLCIGGHSASKEMTFVQPAGQTSVAVIRTTEAEALLEGPAAFWDTTLLKLAADQRAVAMEIRRDKERIVLAADPSGVWRMSEPVVAPADAAAIEEAITALRDLSAQRIVALDRTVPAKYARAEGLVTVVLTTTTPPPTTSDPSAPPKAETKTYTVHALRQEGSVYAWLEGPSPAAVGLVNSALLDKLTAEFRRRDVGIPTDADVEGIKITLENTSCTLQRLLGQWRCQADPHLTISGVKVDAFLQNVRLLKAQRFASYRAGAERQREFGLGKPYLTVEITPTEGAPYRLVVSPIGAEGSGARYAAATGVEGVFLLPGQAVMGLSKTLDDFRD